MTPQELFKAKDPDLLTSVAAIKRAAETARKIAMQTDTGIVIIKDGKIVRISGEALRTREAK